MPGSEPTQEGAPGTLQLLAVVHTHCSRARQHAKETQVWSGRSASSQEPAVRHGRRGEQEQGLGCSQHSP